MFAFRALAPGRHYHSRRQFRQLLHSDLLVRGLRRENIEEREKEGERERQR